MTGSRLCHAIPTLVLLCLVILSAAHSVAGQDNQPIARRLLNRSTGPKYASFAKALEVAEGSGQFSILFAALDAAGLDIESAFAHGARYTILAPTDAAFTRRLKLLGVKPEDLLKNTALLTQILSYHVIPDRTVFSKQLRRDPRPLTTLEGSSVRVRVTQAAIFFIGGIRGNNARVTFPDIRAGKTVVIHVINDVLIPPSRP